MEIDTPYPPEKVVLDPIKAAASHYGATPRKVEVEIEEHGWAQSRSCFNNAHIYVGSNPQALYVLGYLSLEGMPIEHAWVKNIVYKDVTLKKATAPLGLKYFSLFELTYEELVALIVKYETVPSLYECYRYRLLNPNTLIGNTNEHN